MGTILTGYGDAAYDHEGYAAHVLADGGITGGHSPETGPWMSGQLVAACACGWTGSTRYPARGEAHEDVEELALAEWEATHARPLLEQAQRDQLAAVQRRLRTLGGVDVTVARTPGEITEHLTLVLDALGAATRCAQALRDQARQQTENPR